MLKEVIKTGKTVEEAIEFGCLELGKAQEDIQFEIIDLPKKGFLGLGNRPAKVRVYFEEEEKRERPAKRPEGNKPNNNKKREPEAKKPAKEPAKENKENANPPKEKKNPKPEAPKKEEPKERTEEPAEKEPVYPENPTGALSNKTKEASAYLGRVLTQMGLSSFEIKIFEAGEAALFLLDGDGLGVAIGRRGETLDSLQYLCNLVANRVEGGYVRITLDSGDYRQKREKTLEALAKKLANNALKTGRSSTLEPMNPYERRIIHATVATIEGVTSTSVGSEPNRRVVISPVGGGRRSGGKGGSGRGNRGRRNGRYSDRPKERDAEPVVSTSKRQTPPSEGEGQPLYGKIEL